MIFRYEIVAPTVTTDRICDFNGTCLARSDAYDVVLLIDASGSVGSTNFNHLMQFSRNVITHVNVEATSAQISMALFHMVPEEIFDFTAGANLSSSIDSVDAIVYPPDNRATATVAGINFVSDTLLQPEKGHRNVSTVVIIVTDGRASAGVSALRSAASRLQARNLVDVVAIGVSETGTPSAYNTTELEIMASSSRLIFEMTYAQLAAFNGSDVIATAVLGCSPGFVEVQSCTPQHDRVCAACTSSCGSGQFITGECSGAQDFTCSSCSAACPAGVQFESSSCDGVNDRVCSSCSTGSCASDQFSIACNPLADRVCQACTSQCSSGTFLTANCSATADTVCSTCRGSCAPDE